MLKKSSSIDPVICDITTIEEHLDREAIGATEFSDIAGLKELAFVGRSNVGKSSLINKVLGVQMTQTSKTPGKTKDLTFIPLEKPYCRLVDCPGYGYAKVSLAEKERWKKFMQIYLK